MVAWLAAHRVVIAINRVEARIAVPCFVEVNAIAGFCQQILRLFGVIAYAVIGTVGHHAVRRFLSGFGFGQRAGADFFLQGFRLHFLRVDWPDNAVTVTAWHHIYRFGPSEDQPLFDGFMAVTIQYNDIRTRSGQHRIRGRRFSRFRQTRRYGRGVNRAWYAQSPYRCGTGFRHNNRDKSDRQAF
ncbi:Uncharacterised protein [Salmonella enterica subsp. enterica serovar Typhi]|nr:Uncharacterised protein [Salmonella enterica subsp. enterica serovar Typhi]